MASQAPNLTELLSSRICHDLVSPLGAIGNGIELLLMTGTESSPEIALISDSIAPVSYTHLTLPTNREV